MLVVFGAPYSDTMQYIQVVMMAMFLNCECTLARCILDGSSYDCMPLLLEYFLSDDTIAKTYKNKV